MPAVLLVALGGALGAVARYAVGVLFARRATTFPWATLTVNVLGCFGIGLVLAWLARTGTDLAPQRAADLRLLLVVGLLGGFTTFSAFGQETVALARGGAAGLAALSVALNLGLGAAALLLGARLGA